jgi:hypothetical protein
MHSETPRKRKEIIWRDDYQNLPKFEEEEGMNIMIQEAQQIPIRMCSNVPSICFYVIEVKLV